jgi:hypothetical protein
LVEFFISKEAFTFTSKIKPQPNDPLLSLIYWYRKWSSAKNVGSAMNVKGGSEVYRPSDIVIFVDSYLIRFPGEKDTSNVKICKKNIIGKTLLKNLRPKHGNYSAYRLCFWDRREYKNQMNSKFKKELCGLVLGNLQNLHTHFI